mgnify:CR=1 FL=1
MSKYFKKIFSRKGSMEVENKDSLSDQLSDEDKSSE